jgi:anti-sigma B factor antagonist
MALDIQILQAADPSGTGAVIVKLAGSLDTATAPDLERQLEPVLNGQTKDLVFDLENLKFISSAGLRIFGIARKKLTARQGHTSYVHLQPQIEEVFAIVKALPGISVFADVAELDRYLAARQRSYNQD